MAEVTPDPWAEWDTQDGYLLEAIPDQKIQEVLDDLDRGDVHTRLTYLTYEYLRIRKLYASLKAADELASRADQARFDAAMELNQAVETFLNHPETGQRRHRRAGGR